MNPIPDNDGLPVDDYPYPKFNLARKHDIRIADNRRPADVILVSPSGDIVKGSEIGLRIKRGLKKIGRGVKKGAKASARGTVKVAKVTGKAAAWAAKKAARLAALPIRRAFLPIAVRRAKVLATKKGQDKPSSSDKKQAVRDILAAMGKGNVTLKLGAKILRFTGVSGSPQEICGAWEMGIDPATISAAAASISLALKQFGNVLDKSGLAPKRTPIAYKPAAEVEESEPEGITMAPEPGQEASEEAPEDEEPADDSAGESSNEGRRRFVNDAKQLARIGQKHGLPRQRVLQILGNLVEDSRVIGPQNMSVLLAVYARFVRRNAPYVMQVAESEGEQGKLVQALLAQGLISSDRRTV